MGGVAEVHRVCIYCGQPGHFIASCQKGRLPVKLEILVGGLLQTALYSLTLPATLCYNYDSSPLQALVAAEQNLLDSTLTEQVCIPLNHSNNLSLLQH